MNAARFEKVQFQDGAIELLERGTRYTADSPGVGSIGSEALSRTEIERLGRQMSEAQQAFNQVLDAKDGYDQPQMQRVFDDDPFPARPGTPQVTLRLAREAGGRLVPWAGEGPLGWQPSEVRVSAPRFRSLPGVDQDRPEIAEERNSWPDWMQASGLAAPVGEDGLICEGVHYGSALGIVFEGRPGKLDNVLPRLPASCIDSRPHRGSRWSERARAPGARVRVAQHHQSITALLNLISDPWIPVVRRGGRDTVRPDQIAESGVLRPDWPRPDLNLACLELLVGLTYLAHPPQGGGERGSPPYAATLRLAMKPLAPAFDLPGDRSRFLQDLKPLDAETTKKGDV